MDHGFHDRLRLAYSRAILEKIWHDPDLLEIARDNIYRWFKEKEKPLPRDVKPWKDLLDGPIEDLIAVMLGTGLSPSQPLVKKNPHPALCMSLCS